MSEEEISVSNRVSLERITLELVGTTEKASKRVRYVLMVIVTASIIAFSSFWNALDFGWKKSRLGLMSTLCYSLNKDENLYDKTIECTKSSLGNYIDNEFRKRIDDGSIEDVGRFLTDLKNAIAYYKPETLDKDGPVDLFRNLRRMEEESVKTIKIPFFNIGFDINDLGFIGDFSFFILLLILYYSLKREYENLNTVHIFITGNFQEEEKINYYYLMSMSQVLSSPQLPVREIKAPPKPKLSEKSIIKRFSVFFLKHFSKALYFLPFVLLMMIFINDCQTAETGKKISSFSTLVGVWGGFVFTMLILICTLMCVFFSVKFDGKWNEIRAEVASVLGKN